MKTSFFYVTTPNLKTAKKLAKLLVENKLAACVNILPHMISCYKWRGKIESPKEVVMIIKSASKKRLKIENLLNTAHPYDTYCLAEISLKTLNKPYKNWLMGSL